ncbi:MAG TPA: hypothetical protein VF042_15460, partial [Gemmatimonadaceae bacterium]
GWYRVPVFVTSAFLTSVKLGQWSILFTAALFFPVLAVISAAKPQDALPVLASSTKSSTAVFAGLGGIALVAVSFLIFPQWVAEWSAAIRHAPHMTPLILRPGGVLVLAALMKWRRPETWLLLGLVATPHSWGWYAVLPMFTIPASFGEAVFLAGTALAGDWYANTVLDPQTVGGLTSSVGSIIIVTICLPCVAMILRRPNAGESPWWLPRPLSCPLISGRVRGAP